MLGDGLLVLVALARFVRAGGERRSAVRRAVAVGLQVVVIAVVKRLLRRRRPFRQEERPLGLRPRTSSFPSGHTISGFTAAAWLSEDGWPPSACYAAAVLLALTRVHLRLHRASDVCGGGVVAVSAGALVRRLDRML